jgi:2,4-dienoyl-CoA reductase-like NADH-dependent reductase (Old Yellow Enzyme family)
MTAQTYEDPLFQPLQVGGIELKHRIAMAPLTRYRAKEDTLDPTEIMAEYYEQRASDGGLLITEVSTPAAEAYSVSPSVSLCNTRQLIPDVGHVHL